MNEKTNEYRLKQEEEYKQKEKKDQIILKCYLILFIVYVIITAVINYYIIFKEYIWLERSNDLIDGTFCFINVFFIFYFYLNYRKSCKSLDQKWIELKELHEKLQRKIDQEGNGQTLPPIRQYHDRKPTRNVMFLLYIIVIFVNLILGIYYFFGS